LPFTGYLTLWGLPSNETSSTASSCMTEWLALPVPSSTACVAEQVLALRRCCDWSSGNWSVLWNLLCYMDLQLWSWMESPLLSDWVWFLPDSQNRQTWLCMCVCCLIPLSDTWEAMKY
jgi:hypothetical protein